MQEVFRRLFPPLTWALRYQRADLAGDITAGLTTAVMLIPQSMAYAMLAGLPPIVGLYASIVPLAVYALLGTSRQLAVGPVAMVSLMVASGVSPLASGDAQAHLALSVLLAGLVGLTQIAMGLLRLGFLVNFLSHPVISGFTSAAALIIGLSQLKHLLGVSLPDSHYVHEILLAAWAHRGDIQGVTLLLGGVNIALLLALKRWRPRAPAALIAVLLSTLAVTFLGLTAQGVRVVGDIPQGLPTPQLPRLDLDAARALLPTALIISVVGFMESISVAQSFAARNRYRVDADQELLALGGANLAGAFFGAYPVTGGFSRTAVNAQAGSRTPLASLITAAAVALTLLFLTPLLHNLPRATLAAIVMTAVFGLIDVREARQLWHVRRQDLAMLGVTFVGTLTLGIEQGIGLGVLASLILVLRRTLQPHVAILGQTPDEEGRYRNVARRLDLHRLEGIAILRFDADLYFANAGYLRQQVERLRAESGARTIILDCSAINDVDATGAEALEHLTADLRQVGTRLRLARVKGPVLDVLERTELLKMLGEGGVSDSVHEAVFASRAAEGAGDRAGGYAWG